jgi:glycosyltransferase involved in cell wall biosynthesis
VDHVFRRPGRRRPAPNRSEDAPIVTESRRSPHEGKPRLRILIGADTFAPEINGAVSFITRLSAGLAARGHDVHIAAPAYSNKVLGPQRETFEGHEVTVHRIYSWRWYPHPWLRYSLPWRIEQNARKIVDLVKPDVIHFQSHVIIGRGLTLAGQQRGIRLIGTNHVMPENLLDYTLIIPEWFKPRAVQMAWDAADRSFRRAERVTAPTQKAATYLEQHTSVRDVLAISCGLDTHAYTPNMAPTADNRIVFVGRLAPEKKIEDLIRAVAALDPSLDATLEIVGGGDAEQHLRRLARDLGVTDRVVFAGYVDDAYLRAALQRAKVFAIASIAELQSISTMEAMASGLPVVAADAMALPHLVHDGENGFLFEPGNIPELAAALTRVLTMPEAELLALKEESLRIVQVHDIERTLDTFESLYRGEPVHEGIGTPAKEKHRG